MKWTAEQIAEGAAEYKVVGSYSKAAEVLSRRWGEKVTKDALRNACCQNRSLHSSAISSGPSPASPPLGSSSSPAATGEGWQAYAPKVPERSPDCPVVAGATKRVLVVPDTHCGFHDKKAWAAMLALASVWKPERVIIIGDFMDTESVSSHPASTSARTYLAEEYYAANVLLDELQAATPDATWLYLEGNHENRVQKWCAQYGELDGLFNVPRSLYIEGSEYHRDTPKLRGMTWVPLSRQPLVIDGVAYLHGHYENMHHAYHHALHEAPKLGVRCVVYGHMHGLQHAVAPHGAEAWCCGFLGDESSRVFKAYTKGRPRPWTLGVLLQEVGYGMVRNIPVRFVDGRALFDGRVIG